MIPLHPILEAMYNRLAAGDEFSINPDTGRLLHAIAANTASLWRHRGKSAEALEIGRYRGVSTAWLYLAGFTHLVSYEPAAPKNADAELLKLLNLHTGGSVGIRLSLMDTAFPSIVGCETPGGYAFCFIDGDHTGQAPARDLAAVRGLMAPGGVIVMHDVGPKCPAVLRAFEEAPESKVLLPTTPNFFDKNSCGLGVLIV